MRTCIIFNPTARGEKAQRFRRNLEQLATNYTLKPTNCAGAARTLATEAVTEGFEIVVAAGGDGTVNEVLNGIADAPDGFNRTRLAVMPLGTINVFAKELALPAGAAENWRIIQQGQSTRIDAPYAEFEIEGNLKRRWFAQLAGAGLDSRAIELVDWNLKKATGPLAYVSAGFRALQSPASSVTVEFDGGAAHGQLVLIGNGRFYGGRLKFFPKADLRDGKLEVCIFPKIDLQAAARCGWGLLTDQMLEQSGAIHLSLESFQLTSQSQTPFELDGDNVGFLPARFGLEKQRLNVVIDPHSEGQRNR